jgi:hypothetical protein
MVFKRRVVGSSPTWRSQLSLRGSERPQTNIVHLVVFQVTMPNICGHALQ